MKPMRLRINHDTVTEFLPPRSGKGTCALIICDGMPSVPSKRRVLEYWSKQGFWVFHPRYKGTWESAGTFLDHDPTEDILEVARTIRNGLLIPTRITSEPTSIPQITHVTVLGASFGGAVALLSSLHREVDKAVALSPVVDWASELNRVIEPLSELKEYVRNSFGEAYRFSDTDFARLGVDQSFFNPIAHITEYDPYKLFIMHAKDDMIVSYEAVEQFVSTVPCTQHIVSRGGHFSVQVSTRFFLGRHVRNFILER